VEKVRALVPGEYSELRVGYAPIPAVEIFAASDRSVSKIRAAREGFAVCF
jgi:hypothetical protein